MNNPLFLIDLKEGEKAVVVCVKGGRGVIQRLTDMGLTPHTEITVIKSLFFGPIEISVRGSCREEIDGEKTEYCFSRKYECWKVSYLQ